MNNLSQLFNIGHVLFDYLTRDELVKLLTLNNRDLIQAIIRKTSTTATKPRRACSICKVTVPEYLFADVHIYDMQGQLVPGSGKQRSSICYLCATGYSKFKVTATTDV